MAVSPAKNTLLSDSALSVCVLASGSKGNAVWISDGETAILVDAGLSGIQIQRRMESRGLSPQDLTAIVVSHEHGDHIQGVGILSRRFSLPVYINPKTAMAAEKQLGKLADCRHFECGTRFLIGDLAIHPFSIPHDAEDPSGFTISRNGTKIGLATDLGMATAMVRSHLQDCALLILEANHDPHMLEIGPYPWPLKQRVAGRTGHLSNDASCRLLEELQCSRLKTVVLAHLSETNNTPKKAAEAFGCASSLNAIRLVVARQDRCTELLQV